MADHYTRKPHTAYESEAMAEQLFSDIQDATYDAEDRIKHYEKKVAKSVERVKKYEQQLEDLLKSKNMDTNVATFSQVSRNPIYPDGKTEDGGSYITSEDVNKTWSIPGMTALRELAARDPVSGDIIRNVNDLIKKETNTQGRLTKRIESLRNLNTDAINSSVDDQEQYGAYKTRLSDMKKIYVSLSNFRNLLAGIPSDLITESSRNDFMEAMAENCKTYINMQSATKNLVTTLYESDKYTDDFTQKTLCNLLDFLVDTPAQYRDCVPNPVKYVLLATGQLSEVQTLIKKAKEDLDSLVKDKINPELSNLKNSVTSVLRSSVKKSIIEPVNKDQRISINKEQIDKKSAEVKGFVGTMERLGAAVRAGNQNLDKLLNEQPRDLIKKSALISGFPVQPDKNGKDVLRDNVREYVRSKFGGDTPFCDEVIVYGADGTKEFVKRSEAVEVSAGVYKKASGVTKDKFLRNYMDDSSNVYSGGS